MTVTQATLSSLEAAQAAGRSTWRVSSTVFAHVASDQVLEPLGHFATQSAQQLYPATKAGDQVRLQADDDE